jgi:hypothetical protein
MEGKIKICKKKEFLKHRVTKEGKMEEDVSDTIPLFPSNRGMHAKVMKATFATLLNYWTTSSFDFEFSFGFGHDLVSNFRKSVHYIQGLYEDNAPVHSPNIF